MMPFAIAAAAIIFASKAAEVIKSIWTAARPAACCEIVFSWFRAT
jgi:hypothetical protein